MSHDFASAYDEQVDEPKAEKREKQPVKALPYSFREPHLIPTRQFLFGRHAVRKFACATVAPGGIGKTSTTIAEQLALSSGRDLFDDGVRAAARAWYLGLEDPLDEYERRVAAVVKHYGMAASHFNGGFFLSSGREADCVIAREDRRGVLICSPVVEAITAEVRRNSIALITVDPFVASHRVNENDNNAIDAVARTWAQIADETGAAVELVHHVRKLQNGQEITADDARGARALIDACRSVRMLAPMTAEEAAKSGIEERRRFFRIIHGKENMSLSPEGGAWRQLVSVDLGNGKGGPSDLVGVATKWDWPNPLDDISAADLERVLAKVSVGEWRADAQAKQWIGHAIAEVLDFNLADDREKAVVKSLLKTWMKNGALKIDRRTDPKRRDVREFVVVGQ